MVNQLINPFILCCGNRDYRYSKQRFHLIYIYRTLISQHFIHHVHCNYHRNIHLQKLHGQIQVSLNIGSIHNVDDRTWFLIQDKISGDNLLTAVRGHGINSRKVCDFCIRMAFNRTGLTIHRYSWKVSHMLTGTCQLVKQCSFSTVLISHQCVRQCSSLRQWMFIFSGMILSILSKSRMCQVAYSLYSGVTSASLRNLFDFYLLCFRKS